MSQETHVNSFKELGGRKVCMSFVKMRLGRLISGAKKGKKGPGSRAPMDVAEYLPGGLMTDDVQQVPERWLESCNATTSRNTRVGAFSSRRGTAPLCRLSTLLNYGQQEWTLSDLSPRD